MHSRKKNPGLLLALVAIAAAIALWQGTPARAQSQATPAIGGGLAEITAGGVVTIPASGAPAVIVSAISGRAFKILSLDFSLSAAGSLQFYDGTSTSNAMPVAFYGAANTPRTIDEKTFGQVGSGYTTIGNALCVASNAGTLTYFIRCQVKQ